MPAVAVVPPVTGVHAAVTEVALPAKRAGTAATTLEGVADRPVGAILAEVLATVEMLRSG